MTQETDAATMNMLDLQCCEVADAEAECYAHRNVLPTVARCYSRSTSWPHSAEQDGHQYPAENMFSR